MKIILGIDEPRPADPPVRGAVDLERRVRRRFRVEDMETPVLNVDDARPVRLGPHDVDVRVGRDRRRVLRADNLPVQVRDPVAAVRNEIHRLSDPHRVAVLADIVGDGRGGLLVGVIKPDVLVLPALVAFPVIFLVAPAGVDELLPVGRVARVDAAVEGEPRGRRALAEDRVEVRVAADDILEHGAEDDPLSVGRPAHDLGAAGAVGQPLRLAAPGRHRVDGLGPVVIRREGQPPAVRREPGVGLRPRERGQARRRPAPGRDLPQIAFEGESDPLAVDRGRAHETDFLGRDESGGQGRQPQDQEHGSLHLVPLLRSGPSGLRARSP